MIEVFKIVHNFYDSRAVVKLDFIILTPLVQLEAINLNYKNIIVTTILENIHLFPELLIIIWNSLPDYVVEADSQCI